MEIASTVITQEKTCRQFEPFQIELMLPHEAQEKPI